MSAALLIDFGSTWTKLRVLDIERQAIIGSGQGPSTVTTDVTIGMNAALADLELRIGRLPHFRYRLASSSAAGGLRMVTVGLVRELTAEAARRAALGAGAKLVGTFAYRLTAADVARIAELAPDILLLAGGTDGGNRDIILHNAEALGKSSLDCPIVVAGNRDAADDARAHLGERNVIITDNVMPEFNRLEIEPARAAIRKIFIERIVHAKGIDRARETFDAVLMPTPAAVLEGAKLLADGHGSTCGIGPLMVIDPGGATTDVHSVADGAPVADVVMHGLPEPRDKRTVEGDLGMRHNAANIADAAGLETIAHDAGLDLPPARAMLDNLLSDVERLPQNAQEAAFDQALGQAAIRIAVQRHCGRVETVYTPTGPVTLQHGKDLTAVRTVIGTGGVLAHATEPQALLAAALASADQPDSLRPRRPQLMLDRDYLLYACGLLGAVAPEAAIEIALKHLVLLDPEAIHERTCHA
ncbi:MAG TPA: methylaspartate mutase accessory protein GlmL [Burkholderiales bacterium]|nr:methylaspartate mutase accessory protein GlmL [Burkholderiales bacterium]